MRGIRFDSGKLLILDDLEDRWRQIDINEIVEIKDEVCLLKDRFEKLIEEKKKLFTGEECLLSDKNISLSTSVKDGNLIFRYRTEDEESETKILNEDADFETVKTEEETEFLKSLKQGVNETIIHEPSNLIIESNDSDEPENAEYEKIYSNLERKVKREKKKMEEDDINIIKTVKRPSLSEIDNSEAKQSNITNNTINSEEVSVTTTKKQIKSIDKKAVENDKIVEKKQDIKKESKKIKQEKATNTNNKKSSIKVPNIEHNIIKSKKARSSINQRPWRCYFDFVDKKRIEYIQLPKENKFEARVFFEKLLNDNFKEEITKASGYSKHMGNGVQNISFIFIRKNGRVRGISLPGEIITSIIKNKYNTEKQKTENEVEDKQEIPKTTEQAKSSPSDKPNPDNSSDEFSNLLKIVSKSN